MAEVHVQGKWGCKPECQDASFEVQRSRTSGCLAKAKAWRPSRPPPEEVRALAEAFAVPFGLRIELASSIDSGVGQTDHRATDHSLNANEVGPEHPAQVLLLGDVQAVV